MSSRAHDAIEIADEYGRCRSIKLIGQERGVMFEGRWCGASGFGKSNPELDALQRSAVVAGCLFGVSHAVPRRHQIELAGHDDLLRTETVAVQRLSVNEPRHGLQSAVRVRSDVETALFSDVGWAHVVGEAPGANRAVRSLRQCAANADFADPRVMARQY